MDDQRLADLPCGPDVPAETLPLPFEIAFEPVIVQSRLADSHDPRIAGQSDQAAYIRLLTGFGIRMDAGGGENIRESFCQAQNFWESFQGDRHTQSVAYAIGFHRAQDAVNVSD